MCFSWIVPPVFLCPLSRPWRCQVADTSLLLLLHAVNAARFPLGPATGEATSALLSCVGLSSQLPLSTCSWCKSYIAAFGAFLDGNGCVKH